VAVAKLEIIAITVRLAEHGKLLQSAKKMVLQGLSK